jgi:hypothetical protein
MGLFKFIGDVVSRNKRRKAQTYMNKASAVERQQAQLAAAVQRRDLVRQARIARARTVSAAATEGGGLQSSAPMGAISSLGSQASSNLNYFDRQIGLGNQAQGYKAKAGKYMAKAENAAFWGGTAQFVADLAGQSIAGMQANAAEVKSIQSGWSTWDSSSNPVFPSPTIDLGP